MNKNTAYHSEVWNKQQSICFLFYYNVVIARRFLPFPSLKGILGLYSNKAKHDYNEEGIKSRLLLVNFPGIWSYDGLENKMVHNQVLSLGVGGGLTSHSILQKIGEMAQ